MRKSAKWWKSKFFNWLASVVGLLQMAKKLFIIILLIITRYVQKLLIFFFFLFFRIVLVFIFFFWGHDVNETSSWNVTFEITNIINRSVIPLANFNLLLSIQIGFLLRSWCCFSAEAVAFISGYFSRFFNGLLQSRWNSIL